MNYYEIIDLIKNISLQHPFVNSFFNDRYALIGNEDDIDYGVISLLNETHQIGEQISIYRFKIIYADRLTDDNNKVQIQSVGIDTITEIWNALKNVNFIDITDNLNFNIFENQFADNCAGCITDLNITVKSKIGSCEWINECEICQKNN